MEDRISSPACSGSTRSLSDEIFNQSLEVSLASKEIANLDLNLLEILSKSPQVVLFDEEDPTWVKIRINSKVEIFDLEEPRGRILALLNAL